ncbi:RHS repeat-associated core domain-containing protein [Undibacterium sp. 5I1]|uniref:RHS repeat-associated core domain-containing protein n=1 Tax=unclassified Undibacterium TaxID=2630295 RepID=UPI002AB5DD48|nr:MULTISPECIES: RHS repeat-associated core domain-containing protein [unclassified Undibacterium]MDY7537168.1 RHS repeat-associated core domain-containing protein [Undibacterium sp. 5I1]MEB0229347.1 RHS repeat-associated core domain-containing protein [Undibacterium sp. 10I3]MEB0256106.1 RHS repeat-associated core domain-containing protein [Undibacterium sp. 5I1]
MYTGLTYMQQRYYDPAAGRFLSEDPVLTDANTGTGFNRYVYASNNPYRYIDPNGRAECTTDGNGCKHYGTPQKTDPNDRSGHAKASAKIGEQLSKQGAKEVHYNRPFSAITGNPAAGLQRADVAAVWSDNSVSTVEVISPMQTPASQIAKGEAMQAKLNSIGRAGTANTVSIGEGLSGVAIKGVGSLSILSPVVRAFELQKMGGAGSPIPVGIGIGYMGG